jgi:hypothetical protein
VIDTPSRLRLIRKTTTLARIFPTLDLSIEAKAAHVNSGPCVVYYESMKRKLKIKPIYECRCNWKTTHWGGLERFFLKRGKKIGLCCNFYNKQQELGGVGRL